jgi:VanZ family protein
MKIIFILLCILFFIFALIPINSLSSQVTVNGPLKHIAAFFLLTYLLGRAFPSLTTLQKIGLLLAYGASIEIAQAFIPYRTASLFDLLMDTVGIAVYFAVKRVAGRSS